MRLKHTIGDFVLQDNEIYVEETMGVFDLPKRKPISKYDWFESNGYIPDLNVITHEARKITLKCWVKGDDWREAYKKFMLLQKAILKMNLVRLRIDFIHEIPPLTSTPIILNQSGFGVQGYVFKNETHPLIYEVYCEDEISFRKTFRNSKSYVKFDLKLIESLSMKRVYMILNNNVNVMFDYGDRQTFHIFWGDGKMDTIVGDQVAKSHTYTGVKGKKYIAIYGNVRKTDAIERVTVSNSELIWDI